MQKEKISKKHAVHGFSQFRLTNNLLQNLNKFEITPTAKLVLLYLSSCYNPKKADMFPKQKTIAAKIGVSERSVVRAVSELIKAGLILVECKYSNRYQFGSNIAIWSEKSNKIFVSDNLSDDIGQNDAKQDDKMSSHEHEPMNEQKKEPVNVENYKILKNYAEQKGAKNVKAYIEALHRNGSAQNILTQYKEKRTADKFFEKQIAETIENNKKVREGIENAVMPWESEAMKEAIKRLRDN